MTIFDFLSYFEYHISENLRSNIGYLSKYLCHSDTDALTLALVEVGGGGGSNEPLLGF